MPTITGRVTEKWSKAPVADLVVTVNDEIVTATDEGGRFAITLANGTYKICVLEEGGEDRYEANCQNVILVSDITVNIQMKPIMRAL